MAATPNPRRFFMPGGAILPNTDVPQGRVMANILYLGFSVVVFGLAVKHLFRNHASERS
jgi:hypothetical protein